MALESASVLTPRDVAEAWTEDQLRNFLFAPPYTQMVKFELAKGRIANVKTVHRLLASVPSVRNTLLSGGGNNEVEQQLCHLFRTVLHQWKPPSERFTLLKDLQMQFVNQLQVAQERHNQGLREARAERDDEPEDEEIVESIMEARLAAQGRDPKRKDEAAIKSKVKFFNRSERPLTLVHLQDFPPNMVANEQLLGVASFWQLKSVDRIGLLYTLLSKKVEQCSGSLSQRRRAGYYDKVGGRDESSHEGWNLTHQEGDRYDHHRSQHQS